MGEMWERQWIMGENEEWRLGGENGIVGNGNVRQVGHSGRDTKLCETGKRQKKCRRNQSVREMECGRKQNCRTK